VGHRFDPRHVDRLFSPERMKQLPPDELLDWLNIRQTDTVADVGCGPGYFTIPAAERTKENVYAIDVSEEMLGHLAKRCSEAGRTNVRALHGNAGQIPLGDDSVDRIICSMVLHEVDSLTETLTEFRRILRADGRVLVVEWEKKPTEHGPPVHHRLGRSDLVARFVEHGFQCTEHQPNPDNYVVVANVDAY